MSIWVHGRFLYNPITPIDPVKGNLKDILRTHELNHNKEPCKGRFRQGLQSRFRNRPARLPKGSFQIDPVFLSHPPPNLEGITGIKNSAAKWKFANYWIKNDATKPKFGI